MDKIVLNILLLEYQQGMYLYLPRKKHDIGTEVVLN